MRRPTVPLLTLAGGVALPHLGFGTFKLDDETVERVLAVAFTTGYRLVDTADAYGNETGVGRAVRRSDLPRDEIVVSTKCYQVLGYDAVRRSFDATVARMGLEYVDLYLLHWPRPDEGATRGSWRAMEALLDEGRIRAAGVANYGPDDLGRLLAHADVPPAVNQIEVHPWCARAEQRKLHEQHGIVTEAWGPLGRGRGLLAASEPLARAGRKHGRSPAQIALRWQVQRGIVPIPKSADPERMAENIDVFDFQLDADDLAALACLDTGHLVGPEAPPYPL